MKKTRSVPADHTHSQLEASFRDPAGFMYRDGKGKLYRQVNKKGVEDYSLLKSSGLYEALAAKGLLIPHKEVPLDLKASADAAAVVEPHIIPFISYPFEWSFSQLKDAALLTLQIQKMALKHEMSLKDASAYNIQFDQGRPIFIDTLSFEAYRDDEPWQAYRQFCQHFLAPLTLMAFTDINLSQLLRVYTDGVPLDLTQKLLPRRAKLKPGIAVHISMHARAQAAKASSGARPQGKVSKLKLEAILDNLTRTVKSLKLPKAKTEWGNYYENTNYTSSSEKKKAALITNMVSEAGVKTVLDMGGNNGSYSRPLHKLQVFTVCADYDPLAVEDNYQVMKQHKEKLMLPLLVDLTNPGGALGWANKERDDITERLACDMVMALALVHHLAISNNLPLDSISDYLRQFGKYLLIEFVPKSDSQVKILLATRKDIFPGYNEVNFEKVFSKNFKLIEKKSIKGTKRTLYLYKRK